MWINLLHYVRPSSLTPTSTWQSALPTTFQTNNESGSNPVNPVNLGAQPDKFFFEPPPSNKSQTVSGHGTQCDRCGWNFDNESFLQVLQSFKTLTITTIHWNKNVFEYFVIVACISFRQLLWKLLELLTFHPVGVLSFEPKKRNYLNQFSIR